MLGEPLNGFVLHRRAYRETSYLTDLFTLELGKVSAVVKGVRGNKSDKKSLLQAFQPLLLSVSGKHELRNLNQLEANGSMLRLTGHQLFSAMYLNELLNRLLPKEVPHPQLYAAYQQSLQMLAAGAVIEPCLRQFELLLLEDLGYGLDLSADYENGQAVQAGADYSLVLENGFKRIEANTQGSNRFKGALLLQVQQQDWDQHSLHCAKRITRMALTDLLGPKPLKSRELFQQKFSVVNKDILGN